MEPIPESASAAAPISVSTPSRRGFGEGPLLPSIIDPFGKRSSDFTPNGGIKLRGTRPVTLVLKTLPARESSLL